jgi:predicted protein tyrosine phosphatase
MPTPIRYHFTQRFPLSARKAYEWCTDFTPDDYVLMGEENVERKITRLTTDTVILADIFRANNFVEKQRLVQLYPDKLFWTSTHLMGPNKYSQFLYQISEEGENASRLEFTALHLDYSKEKRDSAGVKQLADKLCSEDSQAWKLLTLAMAKRSCLLKYHKP